MIDKLVAARRFVGRGLAAMFLATLLSACASAGPTAQATDQAQASGGPGSAATSASPIVTLPPTRFDGQVAVGGGRSLAVRCLGTGSPTVLLEAGGTRASLRDWGSTFPSEIAKLTTVCEYSHAGGQGSSDAVEPITWANVLADADAVLAAMHSKAGIGGPYVFVGWSFGGEVALGEAVENPSRTAGLVILDTDFPIDSMKQCLASGRAQASCQADFDSDLEAKVIEVDLVKSIKPLPGVPIAIVSALRPSPDCTVAPGASATTAGIEGVTITAADCPSLMEGIASYDLTQWRTLGPQVSQTLVDADHDGLIQEVGPQLVDVIAGVLAQGR
jgi:pimeloyl-ACP methyl ester carboxylesterase